MVAWLQLGLVPSLIAADGSLSHALITKPRMGRGVTVRTCFLLETKRFGKEEIGLFCFNVLIHKSRHIFEASKQNYSGRQPGDKLLSNFSLML